MDVVVWEEINLCAAQHHSCKKKQHKILKSQNIILEEKNMKDEERIQTHTSHIKKIEE